MLASEIDTRKRLCKTSYTTVGLLPIVLTKSSILYNASSEKLIKGVNILFNLPFHSKQRVN